MANRNSKRTGSGKNQSSHREPYSLRSTPARLSSNNTSAGFTLLSTTAPVSTMTATTSNTSLPTSSTPTNVAAGGSVAAAARATNVAKLFEVPELFDMVMQNLDLTSLSNMSKVDRLSFNHILKGLNSRKIRFLAPTLEEARQFSMHSRSRTVREVLSNRTTQHSTRERSIIQVYEINPILDRIDDDNGSGDIGFDRIEAMEGHTDIKLPYQAYKNWKHINVRDLQITKPAIFEVQFNYTPADEDADKVNLEIKNQKGVKIADIIDAVKARGDADDEEFLVSRLWHSDIVLLHKSELETLEAIARGS